MNQKTLQTSTDYGQPTKHLRDVAGRLESLLMKHLAQWDDWVAEASTLQDTEGIDYHERLRELEAERERFESDRREERERLEEDAARLANAWRELEHEQREVRKQQQMVAVRSLPEQERESATTIDPCLASLETAPTNVAARSQENTLPHDPNQPSRQYAEVNVNQGPQETVSLPAADANRAQSPTSRQGTAQFQQLRREMMQHARRKKRR